MSSIHVARTKPSVSIKSVAVPAEHGGWGFLSEPILLGLLIAPSLAGLSIGIAATALFLLHQPLKIAVKDRRKGRVYERTRLAERFLALYGVIGGAALVTATLFGSEAFWIPLLLSLPFAAVQIAFELRNDGRNVISEIFGALALASTAPAIVLAAGQNPVLAILSWLVLALRIVPAILYVRTRLRLIHGKPANPAVPLSFHVIAAVISGLLWIGGMAEPLLMLATGVLLLRALYGLLIAKSVPARTVGFQELGFGLFYTVICAVALIC